METCRTCLNRQFRTGVRSWSGSWNGLVFPSTRHLEVAGPGAAAHMSLHLDLRCQRAQKTDALSFPFFSGRPVRLVFDDRRSVRPPFGGPRRCGERAYMWGVRTRQQRFGIFCLFFETEPESRRIPRFLPRAGHPRDDASMTAAVPNRPNRPSNRGNQTILRAKSAASGFGSRRAVRVGRAAPGPVYGA
jgi:hypothetical protein